jgi:hypothetical protein
MSVAWEAALVAFLAGFVGLAELVGRYRSDPVFALRHSLAAWVYIALNAVAGTGALLVIRAFGWTFGDADHVEIWRILVAGFSAIAFFRSSLFVARVGGANVGVGPSLVLGSLLDACDRDVDRKNAEQMSGMLKQAPLLAGLNPDTVMFALPVLCLALMQNFPPSDQAQLGAELVVLRKDDTLSADAKMRTVIVHLSKYLGEGVVRKVLENAREVFLLTPPVVSLPSGSVVEGLIEQAKREIDERSDR